MSETYTNITPEQARKLSQEHTNWQEVCQRHIDTVVPEACKLGKYPQQLGGTMPNTQFEKLRELAIKRKIFVITASQPPHPGKYRVGGGRVRATKHP